MRDSMSPLYRPVPQSLNISNPAAVAPYFPNLAKVRLGIGRLQLPLLLLMMLFECLSNMMGAWLRSW